MKYVFDVPEELDRGDISPWYCHYRGPQTPKDPPLASTLCSSRSSSVLHKVGILEQFILDYKNGWLAKSKKLGDCCPLFLCIPP